MPAATAAALVLAGCLASAGTDRDGTTPAAPSAHATYDAEERALYRRAVRHLERFERENQPILAAGKAIPEAKRLYQVRLRDWEPSWALLRQHEREGIRIARRPVVLSTAPTSVQVFQDNAVNVVLRRCTDLSGIGMTRNGSPVEGGPAEPVVQEALVYRYENRTWLVGSVETTDTPCSG